MNAVDRNQLFAMLIALITALFVASGLPGPWRRPLRRAAIAIFVLALALVLADIAFWVGEPGR